MNIKILLADDHKIVSDCLEPLLNKQPDMQVVARAENGQMAVRLTQKMEPDVVIMDIAMPDLNGIEATRQIIAHCPGVKVIALSMNSGRRFVKGILNAGASGYLTKNCSFEELVSAVRNVVANKKYLSPEISDIVIEETLPTSSLLTTREREVLQLLAEGMTVKEIASQLHRSIKTIHTHRKQIMEKLGIHSIAELTKYALREGLTSLK